MKKLIIIGGSGIGSVVASTVADINKVTPTWNILGFLNDHEKGPITTYPVLGPINRETVAPYLDDPEVFFFWGLVSAKLRLEFLKRLHELEIPEHRFATIIHPSAVVSDFAELGYGVSVQPFVNIGPEVKIQNHVYIFAQAMLGHHASLNSFSFVANNACVGAYVHLEEGAYLGTNATVREHVVLGAWSITGMGSVVLQSVPPGVTVVGNPAKTI